MKTTLEDLAVQGRRPLEQHPGAGTEPLPWVHQGVPPLGRPRLGVVTSGAPSPTLGHPIAMAYVDRAHSEPGTELQVDIRGKAVAATVVELPFYRRNA